MRLVCIIDLSLISNIYIEASLFKLSRQYMKYSVVDVYNRFVINLKMNVNKLAFRIEVVWESCAFQTYNIQR